MIDLWRSNRDKFHKCEYWDVNEDEYTTRRNQLVYNSIPTGTFMAKIADSESESKQNVEDSFQFDSTFLALETMDDVSDLKSNNRVRFKGKMYIVLDVDKIPLRKNAEQFLEELVPYKYYISLRG